jgi:hypothetical protein
MPANDDHVFTLVVDETQSWPYGYRCSCGMVSMRHRTEQSARMGHGTHATLTRKAGPLGHPRVEEHW